MGISVRFQHSEPLCTGTNFKGTRMKYQKTFAIAAFLMLCSTCSGHIGGSLLSRQHVDSERFCGRNLARAIAMLCLNEEPTHKRSEATMYGAILSPYYMEEANQIDFPWLAPHKARSLGYQARGKRLVVNECCEKHCSIDELLDYC